MLDHLDDPNPPEPSVLAVDRIMAEGGRRLRRRRALAGSGIALASTLAVAGIAFAAVAPDRDTGEDVDTNGPSEETPWTPPDTTVPNVPATLPPGTSAPTTTATTAPGTSAAGTEPFVALLATPRGDRAEVAQVDSDTGEVIRVLTDYALDGVPPLCCIEVSPLTGGVFYVLAPGQGEGSTATATIWHVAFDSHEEPVTEGSYPSVSPDGTRLAFILNGPDPAVVVRDIASGDEQVFPAATEDFLRDVAWADDDTVVVTRNALESSTRAWTFPVSGEGRPIDGIATPLDPPAGSPAGTSWTWVEARPDMDLDVIETYCALDAGTYEGTTYHLVVDPGSGEVVSRTELPSGIAGVATGPNTETLVLGAPTGEPDTGRLSRIVGGGPVEVPGGLRVIAADW